MGKLDASNYSEIDATINTWSKRYKLTMINEFAGLERRFCYISGLSYEVFMISVEPPAGDTTLILAGSVETVDDEDMLEKWNVPTAELGRHLDAALAKVNEWAHRPAAMAAQS